MQGFTASPQALADDEAGRVCVGGVYVARMCCDRLTGSPAQNGATHHTGALLGGRDAPSGRDTHADRARARILSIARKRSSRLLTTRLLK